MLNIMFFVLAYTNDSWIVGYMASKKTTSGNRLDVGWQYGIDVDKNSKKIQCKFC